MWAGKEEMENPFINTQQGWEACMHAVLLYCVTTFNIKCRLLLVLARGPILKAIVTACGTECGWLVRLLNC